MGFLNINENIKDNIRKNKIYFCFFFLVEVVYILKRMLLIKFNERLMVFFFKIFFLFWDNVMKMNFFKKVVMENEFKEFRFIFICWLIDVEKKLEK